jgi:energy-coupling factor transport system substrate-specific component
MKKGRLTLALVLCVGIAAIVAASLGSSALSNWGLVAAIVAVLAVVAFFFEFESAALSSREIALVAMLGTVSAVARIPFAALPGVQPSTYLIICAGYVFGPVAGFMVGAMTPLVSNFFLGQGPWTPFQMLAWGFLGVLAASLRRFRIGRVQLVLLGLFAGYLYGWIVNIWYWASFIYPLNFRTLLVYQLQSIWFDTFHAVGNAIFLGLFGVRTIRILERFRARFNWKLSTELRDA